MKNFIPKPNVVQVFIPKPPVETKLYIVIQKYPYQRLTMCSTLQQVSDTIKCLWNSDDGSIEDFEKNILVIDANRIIETNITQRNDIDIKFST